MVDIHLHYGCEQDRPVAPVIPGLDDVVFEITVKPYPAPFGRTKWSWRISYDGPYEFDWYMDTYGRQRGGVKKTKEAAENKAQKNIEKQSARILARLEREAATEKTTVRVAP